MIIDILTIVGLTIIITTSKMLKPFREFVSTRSIFFGELLSCSLCTGFWVGLFFYLLPENVIIDVEIINIKINFNIFVKTIISYAALGSVFSEVMYLIINRLKIK